MVKTNSDELKANSNFCLALDNKFANLMIKNKLDKNQLIEYFKQDYFFVEEDIKILKTLIKLSRDKKEKIMLKWFLRMVNTEEIPYLKNIFFYNNINVNEVIISSATREYITFIEDAITRSNYLELLTILYAGESLYFQTFSEKKTGNYYINQWETLHSEDLGKLVNFLRRIIDGSDITNDIVEIFNSTINFEISFYQQFL